MKKCLHCSFVFEKSNFKTYCCLDCYQQRKVDLNGSVLVTCQFCNELVVKYKSHVYKNIYCSLLCANRSQERKKAKTTLLECENCGKSFLRHNRNIRHEVNVCDMHCRGELAYKNRTGIHDPKIKRNVNCSQLEHYLRQIITFNFPYLELIDRDRSVIGPELDFYFPELNLAIEVNGIVHYKPIYGIEQLDKVQSKDLIKTKLCKDNNIELIVIKSVVKFSESEANTIWNEQIFPVLLSKIPYCQKEKDDFVFDNPKLVHKEGIEPSHLSIPGLKSGASTISATCANNYSLHDILFNRN